MIKYKNRIAVIIILSIVFIMLYMIVGAAFGKDEVKFAYWVDERPCAKYKNFVIIGTDEGEVRTDLILLCQYREDTNTLNALQIPRDTKIETTNRDKKINSVYSCGGIAKVKEVVASLTGIYPDNYVILNFDGFRQLIDTIGGVTYNVPIRMYYTDPAQNLKIDLWPGEQVLDGEKAEMFMRFRKNNDGSGYAQGDIGRLAAQRSFYGAVIDEVISFKGLINIFGIMKTVGNNLETDFTVADLIGNIDNLRCLNQDTINVMLLPGEGKYIDNISYYVADSVKTGELTDKYFKTANEKGQGAL